MNAEQLHPKFARMGARLQIGPLLRTPLTPLPLTLDIQNDADGEYFDIRVRTGARVDLAVVDLRRRDRHLLLRADVANRAHHYLCGHDEQHWFVAGVPGDDVQNVFAAMEALKPAEVLEAQRRQGIKGKDRQRRKNAAYVRQGEWFFLPMPHLHVNKTQVLHNEPLSRGTGSKPHWAEFLYRKGGETVYVCDAHPAGLTSEAYHRLLRERPRARHWGWRVMHRNAEAYVKGAIVHLDHKTIELHVWHKVLMNRENESRAMQHVVFLD